MPLDLGADGGRDLPCLAACAAVKQDREVVVTQSPDNGVVAAGGAQDAGQCAQGVVTDLSPLAVIELSQVIDIDQDHRDRTRRGGGIDEAGRELIVEGAVIQQAGQRVSSGMRGIAVR